MDDLLKKQWNYRLSVLCGTIDLYEIEVKLISQQVQEYKKEGEKVIDELAEKIRNNPTDYTPNNN